MGSPPRLRPGTSPHALRIPPRGGHPALRSIARWRLQVHLGRVRLSPSCPFRLLHTFPPLSGQRGITPAFGYRAPHPSARGTSTLLNNALLSAHYGPLRHPKAPGLSLAGIQFIIPDHTKGLPVLRTLSLCTCCRHYPGTPTGRPACSFTQPQPRDATGRLHFIAQCISAGTEFRRAVIKHTTIFITVSYPHFRKSSNSR